MSSDTERKAPVPQFAPFPQPTVYYFPSQIPVQAPSINSDEAFARALQAEENAHAAAPVAAAPQTGGCRFKSFFCRRGYNRLDSNRGGCCMKDDGRPLGDLTSFVHGLLFGMIAPIFSVLAVYGFESKRLSRTGVLLGNANFFLLLGVLLLSGGHHFNNNRMHGKEPMPMPMPFAGNGTDFLPTQNATDPIPPNDPIPTPMDTPMDSPNGMPEGGEGHEGREGGRHHKKMRGGRGHHKGGKKFALLSVPSFILALIFFIVGKKSECAVLSAYRNRDNKTEEETVQVFSQSGSCKHFGISFVVSFFFSLIGAIFALIIGRKSLRARYGAFLGLSIHTIISGLFASAHAAPFLLLAGLVFAQATSIHFKRAIASADAKEGNSHC